MTRRLIRLGCVALLIWIALFLGGTVGKALLCAVLILLLTEAVYALAMPRNLPVILRAPAYSKKRQELKIDIIIPYYFSLPILAGTVRLAVRHLFFDKKKTEFHDLPVQGRSIQTSVSLTPEIMGMVLVRLSWIEVSGILGIWSRKIPVKQYKEIMIIPAFDEPAMISRPVDTSLTVGEEEQIALKGNDPLTFSGVRPYREGDVLRQIHWKLTGKFDEYMVKEPEEPGKKLPVLFLETRMERVQPAVIDELMERYLAISAELSEDGHTHMLCFQDKRNGSYHYHKVGSTDELDEIYDSLFRTEFYEEGEPAVAGFQQESLFSEMIYVTDYWDGDYNLPERITVTVIRHEWDKGDKQ